MICDPVFHEPHSKLVYIYYMYWSMEKIAIFQDSITETKIIT